MIIELSCSTSSSNQFFRDRIILKLINHRHSDIEKTAVHTDPRIGQKLGSTAADKGNAT